MSTVSTAGAIYFTGLGSGTDFESMISKLVAVEQARVTTYQTWQQTWTNKVTAFQELNSAMLSLRTSLKSMDTISEFLTKSAASSDSDVVSVTADGDAEAGTYTYSVLQLAKNKTMVTTSGYSALTASVNSTGATASMVYTYAGVTYSNAVPNGSTLRDLMNIINTNSATTGVRASTISDGSKYYLQLRGLDTGAENTLTISGATTLGGFKAANFAVTQTNQDAKFKVNGWPLSNAWISRSTNSVTDAIDGLTLSLKASGAGTITVETDLDAVVDNVQSFVDQVNTVKELVQELTKYDSTSQTASILTGNYGLQMIDSMLKNVTAAGGLGFDANRDTYISLSSFGISTDSTEGSDTFGMLVLDTDALEEILASNAEAVARVFAANYEGDTDSADLSYNSYVDGMTKAGDYAVSYTVKNGKLTAATIDGHKAIFSSNSNLITGASGQDESGLALSVANLTDGTYTHTVNLRLGKIGEMVDTLGDLTDSTSGPLAILEDNYNSIYDGIQDKIDRENDRIAQMASNLKDRFSRLDTLLGTYSELQTSLQSSIAQLE